MTTYAINTICYRTQHDPVFREQMRTDPAGAIAPFRLSDEERTALLAGDVVALYRMGAHAFLLGHLQRFQLVGLTRESYQQRMRSLLPPELRR